MPTCCWCGQIIEGDDVLRIHSPSEVCKDADCMRYHWPFVCAECRERPDLVNLPYTKQDEHYDHCSVWIKAEPEKKSGCTARVNFAEARQIMADNLKDPDLRLAYVSNIAMRMYDELWERGYTPPLTPADRDEIAENLLELIFEG